MSYIYKISNTINNKIYIGKTTLTLEKRFKKHKLDSREKDTKLYRAMRKYGKENFYIKKLEYIKNDLILNEREQFWIETLNTIEKGYNTATGGCGGDTLTHNPNIDKIRKKISKKVSGSRNPNSTEVVAKNILTNEILYFDCIKDLQSYLNIDAHAIITRRCSGKTKSPYKKEWLFYYKKNFKEGQETIENTSIKDGSE